MNSTLYVLLAMTVGQIFSFREESLPESIYCSASVFEFKEESLPKELAANDQDVERFEVTLYTAKWCPACKQVDKVYTVETQAKYKLKVKKIDTDKLGSYNGSIPTFIWKTPSGKAFYLSGYVEPKHLLNEIKRTIKENSRSGSETRSASVRHRLSASQLREFLRSYNGPDVGVSGMTFWEHLQDSRHGFSASQLQGLTAYELRRLHGAHHYGYLTQYEIVRH